MSRAWRAAVPGHQGQPPYLTLSKVEQMSSGPVYGPRRTGRPNPRQTRQDIGRPVIVRDPGKRLVSARHFSRA